MAYTNNLRVIAAICGNFFQESLVNPGAWENYTIGDHGYGLGQWSDYEGVVYRRTALFQYMYDHGYYIDNGQGQLEFLIYENVWNIPGPSTVPSSDFNSLSEFLASNSTDLTYLTLEWMYHWEGIDDDSEQTRISYAQSFYTIFLDDDGVRNPWYARNAPLTAAETVSNTLLIKDFFLGGTPPEPPEPPAPLPKKHKGLPPWLIYKLTK